jgi:integrase
MRRPLAHMSVGDITSDDIEATVRGAPQQKRLLRAIHGVFDLAISKGIRTDNPAEHRIMKYRLPNGRKLEAHHKAMPYAEIPAFVSLLRAKQQRHVLAAYVIEFVILTACRASEATEMKWSEINGTTWTIPAGRTKTGREHRVPLSGRAQEILKVFTRAGNYGKDVPVWLSRRGKPIGAHALYLQLTRYMHIPYTIHGVRSSFRDWCAEQTDYDTNVCEMCLAHSVGNETVRAYLRSDMLEKRREIMQAWAAYCG